MTFSVCCTLYNLAFDRDVISDERLARRTVRCALGAAEILGDLNREGLFEMCTLCLSKRSKCCNKKTSWISKLPSVWVEGRLHLSAKDLPNLKVLLGTVLRMNNHFYCHSVQGPSSGQWFPECLSGSRWPCLSRGAWNRWSQVQSNLNHSAILWFWYLDMPDLSEEVEQAQDTFFCFC